MDHIKQNKGPHLRDVQNLSVENEESFKGNYTYVEQKEKSGV